MTTTVLICHRKKTMILITRFKIHSVADIILEELFSWHQKVYNFRNNRDTRHKRQLTCFNCLRPNSTVKRCLIYNDTYLVKIKVAASKLANKLFDLPMSTTVLVMQNFGISRRHITEYLMAQYLEGSHKSTIAETGTDYGQIDDVKKTRSSNFSSMTFYLLNIPQRIHQPVRIRHHRMCTTNTMPIIERQWHRIFTLFQTQSIAEVIMYISEATRTRYIDSGTTFATLTLGTQTTLP